MTPKEKANRLFLKYHNLWINGNSILAKQCALIAVDLAIEVIYKYSIHSDCSEDASLEYWEEVKEEILKL
jgi:hypothetical protein